MSDEKKKCDGRSTELTDTRVIQGKCENYLRLSSAWINFDKNGVKPKNEEINFFKLHFRTFEQLVCAHCEAFAGLFKKSYINICLGRN